MKFFKKNRKCRLPEEIQRFQKKQRGLSAAKIQSAKPPSRRCFAMPPPTIWGPKRIPWYGNNFWT